MADISITANLTPAQLTALDYDTAKSPATGAEKEVYLSQKPVLLLGIARMDTTGSLTYEYFSRQQYKTLTGTVAISAASTSVVGTGTNFGAELEVGDTVLIGSNYRQVVSIGDSPGFTANRDIHMAINAAPSGEITAGTAVTAYPAWPIVAFVMNELKADAAAVPSFVGLTATSGFAPVAYSSNTSYDFAAGRGVELIGTQTGPILAASLPTITNAKRGCRIGFVQIPKLSTFTHIGATRGKDITIPVRQAKYISRGLETTFYTKTGKTTEGRLKITSLDLGSDDGLARFYGTKCCAMIATTKDDTVLTARQFCLNFVPNASETNPDGDAETTCDCEGNFQQLVTLPAPGA